VPKTTVIWLDVASQKEGNMRSRHIKRELSEEIKYSEKDVVLFLEEQMKGSLCGDALTHHAWGEQENQQLFIAICEINWGNFDKFLEKVG